VKRARYAGEAAARALPKAAPQAEALAALQGVLGDQHDAAVAQDWLREVVATGTSRQQAFTAGLLVAEQQGEAAASRQEWRGAWRAASNRKVRAWLRT